jgi:Flp pilus assembly pilin Flp
MKKLLARAVKYVRSTRAVAALEYALLVGVIATVIAAALVTFGTSIETAINKVAAEVKEAQDSVDD